MAGKRVEERPGGHTKRSGAEPFKALSSDSRRVEENKEWVITQSKSLNTREGIASYSKWPQEPEEDFQIL